MEKDTMHVCECIHLVFFFETITLSTFHLSDVLEEICNPYCRLKLASLKLTCRNINRSNELIGPAWINHKTDLLKNASHKVQLLLQNFTGYSFPNQVIKDHNYIFPILPIDINHPHVFHHNFNETQVWSSYSPPALHL